MPRTPSLPNYIRSENILRQEDRAVIEVTPGGPLLLKCQPRADGYGYDWEYAGDVRAEEGQHIVCLPMLYDPETGSDIRVIGSYAFREDAIEKLWSLR